MKTKLLLAASVLLTLAVSSESARSLVTEILEFLGLVGLFASKSATVVVSLSAWLASLGIVLAENVLWDGRFLPIVVLHGAIWFVKVFLFAAVFSGYGK